MLFHKEVTQRCHCSLINLVGWLVCPPVGRSVGGLVGFVRLLVAWLLGRWLVGLLVGWWVGRVGCLFGWVGGWVGNSVGGRMGW